MKDKSSGDAAEVKAVAEIGRSVETGGRWSGRGYSGEMRRWKWQQRSEQSPSSCWRQQREDRIAVGDAVAVETPSEEDDDYD